MNPDQQARFRANTNKGPHVGHPTRFCCKCKKPKPVKGGKIKRSAATGRLLFTCVECGERDGG